MGAVALLLGVGVVGVLGVVAALALVLLQNTKRLFGFQLHLKQLGKGSIGVQQS